MVPLPIHVGFVSADETKKAWLVLHNLKCRVHKDNKLVQDELVLPVSERSYIPLDPNELIKQEDRERLVSLEHISSLRERQVREDAGSERDGQRTLAEMVIVGSFILMGFEGLAKFIMTQWGGG